MKEKYEMKHILFILITVLLSASAAMAALPAALVESASDPDPLVRMGAARGLGETGNADAVPALSKLLGSDTDEFVRLAALGALVQIGDASALPAYTKALKDDSEKVRRSAADALSGIYDEEARRALVAALMYDTSAKVRQKVAGALGNPPNTGRIDPKRWERADDTEAALIGALESDESFEVRATAAANLGRLKGGKSAPPLMKALADKHAAVRAAAAEALGSYERPEVEERLIDLLYFEKDDTVLEGALSSLRHSGDPRLAEPVTRALRSGSIKVKWQAIELMENLRDPAGLDELRAIADDARESDGIRRKAREALGMMGE